MRKRILMLASLGILSLQGGLLAQETADRGGAPEQIVQIMGIRYCPVQDLSRILDTIYGSDGTQIIVDENTNRLIVRATASRMQEIKQMVAALDIAKTPAAPLMCRVYMVEMPLNTKSFTAVLQPATHLNLSHLRKAAEGRIDFHIDSLGFCQQRSDGQESIAVYYWANYNGGGPDAQRVEIYGQAASEDVVKQMLRLVADTQIVSIRWDNKAAVVTVPAAELSRLPEQLRQHIHKFLGAEVQTVGYWFGTMSSPGEIKAPIGPWSIILEVKPTQTDALSIEVMVHEWQGDDAMEILGTPSRAGSASQSL